MCPSSEVSLNNDPTFDDLKYAFEAVNVVVPDMVEEVIVMLVRFSTKNGPSLAA
jgi:hypothetical protein